MKSVKILLYLLIILSINSKAFAKVSLSIKDEEITSTRILFLGFNSPNPTLQRNIREIFEQINRNLKTTNLFEVVEQKSDLQTNSPNEIASKNQLTQVNIESLPDFEKYRKDGIGAVAVASFNYDTTGNIEFRIRLWDVLDQRQIFGKFYTASQDNYQKVANLVSNEIFKGITGESSGHFDSQILYISESGSAKRRIKKINLINFDGTNRRTLSDGQDLVLTPIFSKKRDEIFYLRFFQGKAQIFSLNVKNLRTQRVGGFKGTTFAPSTHPKDPNLLLLSIIDSGNTDIFEMNIAENYAKKLTKSPAIDTTPSYSPDAKSIAFSSDRDGKEQIYIMDADGSSVKLISGPEGSYSKPVFSPDGKLIAFTKIKSGRFFIGVMSPSGKGEKLLTSSYLVEGARWSPSGRYLIYSKKKGPYGSDSIPRLCTVDILTGYEYEIPTSTKEGATDPDWL